MPQPPGSGPAALRDEAPPRRILNPHAVPVQGTDAHLAPVPTQRLVPEALRLRFAKPGDFTPEWPGDGAFGPARAPAAAAVLVPLVQRDDGLHVLLTRRSAHLRDHAGQISFPGGRTEPHDGAPAATALREAHEEVGLPPGLAEVLGVLPAYTTVTHFHVTPVVALLPALDLSALALDRREVDEAFEVPLSYLMTPAHHRRHVFEAEGRQRQFLSMPWHGPGADGQLREYFIWGATAAMLRNLYRFLAG
jgi:8-oxo-dGTP pyrophosphatase MutT (NUDIX family)